MPELPQLEAISPPHGARGYRLPAHRGEPIQFRFDSSVVDAFVGETIAAALLANGTQRFCAMPDGSGRQPFCNMGTCFDCSVTIDGVHFVRACLTPARDGQIVEPEVRW